MRTIQELVDRVHTDVHKRQSCVSLEQLKERCHGVPEAKPVMDILRPYTDDSDNRGAISLIAEMKRASQVKGFLADITHPGRLAQDYERGGASIISVFTQSAFFHGSFDDLKAVRTHVDIPVLQKDFIVCPYQIHEARAYGADMVTLNAALVDNDVLLSFIERVHSLGMTAFVEVYSRLQALQAVEAGAQVIGINTRDIRTLQLDMDTFAQVVDVVPENVVAVAESGVKTPHDVFTYALEGADAVLVGEALVKSTDPATTVADMVAAGQHPALSTSRKKRVADGQRSLS